MRTKDGQVILAPSQETAVYSELRDMRDRIQALAGDQWNWPAVTTLTRPTLARILNLSFLYDQILPVGGSICEFGVHYGASLATLLNLRAIKEPYNYSRHLFGFDTFSGFSGTTRHDGENVEEGDFRIEEGYAEFLEKLLAAQDSLNPHSHHKKFTLVKGDASITVGQWLDDNPHVLVSMAIFDMDIYQPTRDTLAMILPRLCKGSLLVFDELNAPHFPGETKALLETLDISAHTIHRSPYLPFCCFIRYGI